MLGAASAGSSRAPRSQRSVPSALTPWYRAHVPRADHAARPPAIVESQAPGEETTSAAAVAAASGRPARYASR